MANDFDDVQSHGEEQFGAAAAASTCFAETLQTIATETAEYSKKTMENNSAFMERLLGAKSYDTAIQIQSEYWKTSYASFIAQATKIGELYSSLAKEAFATETAEYSKKTMENNSAFVERLLGAKSYDTAIQIQSEYWKTSYASFIAQATKIGELYSSLAKESFKPAETAVTKRRAKPVI